MIKFYPHQEQGLKDTEHLNRVAYYWDMGLGKTFVGGEKLIQLKTPVNLLICQKSKVDDWINHFETYYSVAVFNLTNKKDFLNFVDRISIPWTETVPMICIINYELTFRRKQLTTIPIGTLMLDESSLIQNEQTKRAKFITRLNHENLILLSGTPTAGKYEKLLTQIHLLGWNISEKLFWNHYVDWEWVEDDGFFRKKINGYKNVDRLKAKLRQYGAVFLKSEEVLDLPEQIFTKIMVPTSKEYRKFMKSRIITIDDRELVGDTPLTKRLYARMLCGHYNQDKLEAFKDLVDSTEDRLIVFYNFKEEFRRLSELVKDRPISVVNGSIKDLTAYHQFSDSITFIQYRAGSMGLDLQKANKMIFYSPTESCEQFMQSPERIHRIGQENDKCFYYRLICQGSVEEDILSATERGENYTDALFQEFDS
jgi:SNF2 family DNA or RNA helicase